MKKAYRDKIKKNFAVLVDRIDPNVLLKFLLAKGAIKKKECRKLLSEPSEIKHINRLLLFHILSRHDSVYHKFIAGLEFLDLRNLLTENNDLRPQTSVFHEANVQSNDEYLPIENLSIRDSEPNDATSTTTRQPLVVQVKLAEDFISTDCDRTYDTKSSKRGQVLIINNKYFNKFHKERRGSELDLNCLRLLFEQMFMRVEFHEDLNVLDMRRVIVQFAKFEADRISDICVVVIMSHGKEQNKELVVLDKDDGALETAWIEEQFNNVNCSLFKDKPKVFLYQFCRGKQKDYATTKKIETTEIDNVTLVSTESTKTDKKNDFDDSIEADSGVISHVERRLEDMLVGYATQKGHRAHRDPSFGSWYIQLICEVFMEKAHNTHIVEMLNEVDRKLKYLSSSDFTMQTSSYTSNGFNKLLYFNPGIYLGDNGNVERFS